MTGSNRPVTRQLAKELNIDVGTDAEKSLNPYNPKSRRQLHESENLTDKSSLESTLTISGDVSTFNFTNPIAQSSCIQTISEQISDSNSSSLVDHFSTPTVSILESIGDTSSQLSRSNKILTGNESSCKEGNNYGSNESSSSSGGGQPPNNRNRMTLAANQLVSLRDALEFVVEFDGENISLTDFIESCEEAFATLPEDAAKHLVKLIRRKLKGEARRSIHGQKFEAKEEFYKFLKGIYTPVKTEWELQGELGRMFRKNSESVLKFANRIREMGKRIHEAHKQDIEGEEDPNYKRTIENMTLQCFLKGLKPEIEQRLKKVDKIGDAVEQAIKTENELKSRRILRGERLKEESEKNVLVCESRAENKNSGNIAEISDGNLNTNIKIICQMCSKEGHTADKCYQRVDNSNFQGITCQLCEKRGHTADRCFQNKPRSNFNQVICQICNKSGHTASKCWSRVDNNGGNKLNNPINCQVCNKSGHTAEKCWSQNGPPQNSNSQYFCQLCNKSGHTAERCWGRSNAQEVSNRVICQVCNKTGHTANNCNFEKNSVKAIAKINCQICQSPGHLAKDCTSKNQGNSCEYCKKIGHNAKDCWKQVFDNVKKSGNETGLSHQGAQGDKSMKNTRPVKVLGTANVHNQIETSEEDE